MALKLSEEPVAPPPVKRAPRPVAPKAASPKLAEREAAVNGVFQLAGFGCILVGQHADAGAIGMHGPRISLELARIAEDNEGVANVLDYLNKTGPYAGLILAVLPFTLQILANHGMLNAASLGAAGVVHPDVLRAQSEAELAKQQADAIRAQEAAEAELRAATASISGNGQHAERPVPVA